MNEKMYERREQRLAEYLGAKVFIEAVIGLRKEVERQGLDMLSSDILEALFQHVGDTIQLQRVEHQVRKPE